jgi:hypothetical protein
VSTLLAVKDLSKEAPAPIEATYDEQGKVRTLAATGNSGLFSGQFDGSVRNLASQFIKTPEVRKALGLRFANLVDGTTEEFAPFTRVEYNQVAKLSDVENPIPVRNGGVHIFVDSKGAILQVNNTVRPGRKPKRLGKVISEETAVAAARKRMQNKTAKAVHCKLMLSSHNGNLNPVYEVLLWNETPRQIKLYLVDAKTGKVVFVENRLRHSQIARKGRGPRQPVRVKGRVLLRIPDYTKPISKQMQDAILADLPDAKVLKNERLIMKVLKGSKWINVQAAADGTFNFPTESDPAMAVVVFFAVNEQLKLMESWGLKKQDKAITVYINDPDVSDNAYFDQVTYTIHIGIGSGIKEGGLAKYIAFDIGVEWHENGHHIVYLMTPGKDLPGSQGAGIHESTGDTLGDLLMDFWMRNKYQDVLGKFTKDDIKNDPRIIGVYAMYPDGIRIQKNTKKTPQDETGEPHDDGLISGGATADLLVILATADDVTIEKGLEQYGRLYLTALTLVPIHKVMFKDLLRAFITADKTLNDGKFRKTIEQCFAAHGIDLSTPPHKRRKKCNGKGRRKAS